MKDAGNNNQPRADKLVDPAAKPSQGVEARQDLLGSFDATSLSKSVGVLPNPPGVFDSTTKLSKTFEDVKNPLGSRDAAILSKSVGVLPNPLGVFDSTTKLAKTFEHLKNPLGSFDATSLSKSVGVLPNPPGVFDSTAKLAKTFEHLKNPLGSFDAASLSKSVGVLQNLPGVFDSTTKLAKTFEQWKNPLGPFDVAGLSKSMGILQGPPGVLDLVTKFSRSMELWKHPPGYIDAVTKLSKNAELWHNPPGLFNAATRAMHDLPDWLKPRGAADMLLPSWQVTARLGCAGVVPASLVRDILDEIHQTRADTIAFEAAVEMAEGIDGEVNYLADLTLFLLRKYRTIIIDLASGAVDFVKREGIIATISLFVALASLYENHASRIYSAEQTDLAREQAELARDGDASEPTPIQHEIAEYLQTLQQQIAQINVDRTADLNMRVVIQTAPLRLEPNAKAIVLRRVYPDDRVRVLDVKDGWALVEVYEYKSEATTTGWINRRVLRLPAN